MRGVVCNVVFNGILAVWRGFRGAPVSIVGRLARRLTPSGFSAFSAIRLTGTGIIAGGPSNKGFVGGGGPHALPEATPRIAAMARTGSTAAGSAARFITKVRAP